MIFPEYLHQCFVCDFCHAKPNKTPVHHQLKEGPDGKLYVDEICPGSFGRPRPRQEEEKAVSS
jgi:hypothetical protein